MEKTAEEVLAKSQKILEDLGYEAHPLTVGDLSGLKTKTKQQKKTPSDTVGDLYAIQKISPDLAVLQRVAPKPSTSPSQELENERLQVFEERRQKRVEEQRRTMQTSQALSEMRQTEKEREKQAKADHEARLKALGEQRKKAF